MAGVATGLIEAGDPSPVPLARRQTGSAPFGTDAAAPVAFEDILAPYVDLTSRRLRQEAGDVMDRDAVHMLARSLLHRLSYLATPVLTSEFSLFKSLAGALPWDPAPGGNEAYRAFVAHVRAGGWRPIKAEYPRLAHVLSVCARNWRAAQAEMARRLCEDWPRLRLSFGLEVDACRIVGVIPDMSDPHRGGRSVAMVSLDGGGRLIYKPRSLDMEAGFGEILDFVNAAGFSQPFRRPRLLNCGDHGWMEPVCAVQCARPSEIEAFHHRAGGMLCLLAFLQATDIHHENMIACGDQPVIVDCETMLQPILSGEALGFGATMLATGFLPIADGPDFSAFGANGEVETPYPVAICESVNSDSMAVARRLYRAPPRANVPILCGYREPAAAHGDAVVAGFSEMFRLALRRRAGLRKAFQVFAGRRGRWVARATNSYGLLLQAALQPANLRGASAVARLFEQLRAGAAEADFGSEAAALERLDVPYFEHICDADGPGWASPLRQAIARLDAASEADINAYADALRSALASLLPATRVQACDTEERR